MESSVLMMLSGQPLTRFGLCCAIALLTGLLVSGLWMRRKGMGYGTWIRLCLCVTVGCFVTARLFYALADWIMILLEGIFDLNTGRDPLAGFRFWEGGYSLIGGIVGALLGAMAAERWTGVGKGSLRDALAFGIPAAVIVERLSEQGTGIGLGRYVTSSWLISTGLCPELYGDYVHPVYLYEAAAALILLTVVLVLSRKERPAGRLQEIFLLLFGLSQVILESLRADGHMVEHFVHIQQVYAIILAVWTIFRWCLRGKKTPGEGWKTALGWIVIFAAVGVAIWAEFGVDRWGNQLLAYGVMGLSMLVIGLTGRSFYPAPCGR